MNPTDFAKLAFAGTTSSAAGAGAAAGYGHFIPKTFNDVMNRLGGLALTSDTDFQSVLFDQKNKVDVFVKEWSSVKGKEVKSEADRLTELKSWCQSKSKESLDSVADMAKYRDYYLNLCTTKGITTVKGFLTKWRSSGNWIENKGTTDSEKEISYKGVFSVYKHNDGFLKWINEKKGSSHNKQMTSTSTNAEGYKVLKDVCERGLKMSWGSRTNQEMEKYFFFCTAFKDDTLEGRLKGQETNWKARTSFSEVKNKWYQTSGVQETIKRTNKSDPVGDDDYKKWCENRLKARLGSEEEVYPNDYKFVKQICKEDTPAVTP